MTTQLSELPFNQKKDVTLSDMARGVNNVNYKEEIIVFKTGGALSAQALPVRIDALVICLCKHGEGKISIDLREYPIAAGSLIVIHPNEYITAAETSAETECMIVACSRNVVENVLPKLTDLLPLLIENHSDSVQQLLPREAASLETYFKMLFEKLDAPETPFQKQKVMCLLQSALFEMMEMQHAKRGPGSMRKSRREEIMAKFLLAVTQNFRTERQVTFYADQLCITPKHLSAVVKEISGRTSGEWIDSYVIMEAKVLLHSTDRTIQEIATQLNFANQSFFGKYFKHHTGMSPSEYRRLNS